MASQLNNIDIYIYILAITLAHAVNDANFDSNDDDHHHHQDDEKKKSAFICIVEVCGIDGLRKRAII